MNGPPLPHLPGAASLLHADAALDLAGAKQYAIHYSPAPGSALVAAASLWLGEDLCTHLPCERPEISGLAQSDLSRLTSGPSLSGFRASLTEPFELANHLSQTRLLDAARAFAQASTPLPIRFQLRETGRAFCLVLLPPADAVQALRARCVSVFERLAAPPNGAAPRSYRLRRRGLDPRATQGTRACGDFHLRIALTASIPSKPLRDRIGANLHGLFADALQEPQMLDSITVVAHSQFHGPSCALRRFALGG